MTKSQKKINSFETEKREYVLGMVEGLKQKSSQYINELGEETLDNLVLLACIIELENRGEA